MDQVVSLAEGIEVLASILRASQTETINSESRNFIDAIIKLASCESESSLGVLLAFLADTLDSVNPFGNILIGGLLGDFVLGVSLEPGW